MAKKQVTKAVKTPKTEKKPKEKRAKKAKKDKDAPKRAISAFFFYQKSRRETLKTEQPGLSHTQIVSTMSAEWNKLTDKDKIPYAKMAEGDKVRAEKEKKAYEAKKATEATPTSTKKGKKGESA